MLFLTKNKKNKKHQQYDYMNVWFKYAKYLYKLLMIPFNILVRMSSLIKMNFLL